MPELAEVEYQRKLWDPGVGDKVLSVSMHPQKRIYRNCDTGRLKELLTGQRLLRSETHGKQMLFQFTGNAWLGIHLGMSGSLSLQPGNYSPEKHDHLALHQKKRVLVFNDPRQFGRVRFDEGKSAPEWWTQLPPPILSRKFTAAYVGEFLKRHAKAPVKSLLLDQDMFPGIGNWMADEILWQTRIHPERPGGKLSEQEIRELWKGTRKVVTGALKTVGADYSDPPKTWLFRHRWKQKGYCPRCAALLRRDEVGGRTTAWCADCQPSK